MKRYRVAILGASGAVGQEMLKILLERKFPIETLRLLASSRSAGKQLICEGQTFTIEETTPQSFQDIDIVLGAADNAVAKRYVPLAVQNGAIVIDNSSAYRMDENVPLIIPEVNAADIAWHHGIIANPNCATILALTALQPLHAYAQIKRMIISTYQAVSGAGIKGMKELQEQIQALSAGKAVTIQHFQHQIAYNLIPQIGSFDENGYSTEEMKLQKEGRKIWHLPQLQVSCTCVRVPVIRSHAESIYVEFEKEIDVATARMLLQNGKGVRLVDDPASNSYPMPLDTSNQDLVYVGRIRQADVASAHALCLWCCGDQLRKGAATNAVQIAELLLQR